MIEPPAAPPDDEPYQPLWRKVLLLGVPFLMIVGFVVLQVWFGVSGYFGKQVAAERAIEVESVARRDKLTAEDITMSVVLHETPDVTEALEVPGTKIVSVRSASRGADAHVVLRSTAWGGGSCIVLDVGVDGDVSSTVRSCGP